MTALNHMTDEDLKAMGIPMVRIEILLEFCTFHVRLFPMAIFRSSIDTHVKYGNSCNLKCALSFHGPVIC